MNDESAVQLILTSGFSTSPIITDVSGRGVGMDVVMENISRRLKGAVNIDTELGKGTSISLTVPVTLTIMRGLVVMVGQKMFAIPTRSIEKNIKLPMQQIKSVEGKQIVLDNKRVIPLIRLSDILGVDGKPIGDDGEMVSVVVVDHGQKQVGFCVDGFGKEQEMVAKGLGSYLKGVPTVAGVTILPSGEVVSILHVPDLMEFARNRLSPVLPTRESVTDQKITRKRSILVVDDSLTTRELEKSILEASGYDVQVAVDGLDGLNKIAEKKFDLIISDVQMPRVDGFKMVEELKQDNRYKDIPVIMVTALQRDEEKRKGIEVGASAYIVKSTFEQGNLLETIQTLIG
jgi:two-component system chemotaxis sensor kinase CheA